MKEVVPAALDGERVDRIVSLLLALSRSEAAALVEQGAVRLDGQTAPSGKRRVRTGQEIDVVEPARGAPVLAADPAIDVNVVFADDDVIVVDKPPGLVVHPGAGHTTDTLVNGLLARYPEVARVGVDPTRPGIVHRLDKGTSGLLVVARSPLAHGALVEQLRARAVTREYLALAWGAPAARRGAVDAPIGRSARQPVSMAVTTGGRPARTRFEVAEVFTAPVSCSLWRCRLETGRTHQIRVHLASIGHPVVGDARYGGVRPGLRAGRPLLHAARLAFAHPRSGEPIDLASPLPADMAAVLDGLSSDALATPANGPAKAAGPGPGRPHRPT
jgi:23S rRNA pseudouridine1911/1915/1917 synthase